MGDAKKNDSGLTGKHVEIFLQTPLFRFRYVVDQRERELLENAVRVSGTIVDDTGAGVVIAVKQLSNMRQSETELPFERIFVPYGKIDFIVLE